MKLNLLKLSKEIEGSKFSKSEIASKCGIDRKTIENVLAGRDPKVSTIISLASILGLRISYLFDEEIDVRSAGRDYVEKGKIEHSGTEYNAPVALQNAELEQKNSKLESENAELNRKLIAAQERIIKLMENES